MANRYQQPLRRDFSTNYFVPDEIYTPDFGAWAEVLTQQQQKYDAGQALAGIDFNALQVDDAAKQRIRAELEAEKQAITQAYIDNPDNIRLGNKILKEKSRAIAQRVQSGDIAKISNAHSSYAKRKEEANKLRVEGKLNDVEYFAYLEDGFNNYNEAGGVDGGASLNFGDPLSIHDYSKEMDSFIKIQPKIKNSFTSEELASHDGYWLMNKLVEKGMSDADVEELRGRANQHINRLAGESGHSEVQARFDRHNLRQKLLAQGIKPEDMDRYLQETLKNEAYTLDSVANQVTQEHFKSIVNPYVDSIQTEEVSQTMKFGPEKQAQKAANRRSAKATEVPPRLRDSITPGLGIKVEVGDTKFHKEGSFKQAARTIPLLLEGIGNTLKTGNFGALSNQNSKAVYKDGGEFKKLANIELKNLRNAANLTEEDSKLVERLEKGSKSGEFNPKDVDTLYNKYNRITADRGSISTNIFTINSKGAEKLITDRIIDGKSLVGAIQIWDEELNPQGGIAGAEDISFEGLAGYNIPTRDSNGNVSLPDFQVTVTDENGVQSKRYVKHNNNLLRAAKKPLERGLQLMHFDAFDADKPSEVTVNSIGGSKMTIRLDENLMPVYRVTKESIDENGKAFELGEEYSHAEMVAITQESALSIIQNSFKK